MQRIRYQAARVELALNDSSGSPDVFGRGGAPSHARCSPKPNQKSKDIAFDAKGHEERSTKLNKFNI
jgi:hypothetical protein